jgi:hypothetical protein
MEGGTNTVPFCFSLCKQITEHDRFGSQFSHNVRKVQQMRQR